MSKDQLKKEATKEPEAFLVDANLMAQIANYLTTRPWREVNNILLGIQQVKGLNYSNEVPESERVSDVSEESSDKLKKA